MNSSTVVLLKSGICVIDSCIMLKAEVLDKPFTNRVTYFHMGMWPQEFLGHV